MFPTVNIPTPYGGTPLYDQMRREGRILEATPFAFYYNPYLAITLKHYDPLTYYDKLIEMHEAMASVAMMFRRLGSGTSRVIRIAHAMRTIYTRLFMRDMRQIRDMLASDRPFRAYHEERTRELPPFYNWLFERRLGRYAELVPPAMRRPVPIPQRLRRLRGPGVWQSESESRSSRKVRQKGQAANSDSAASMRARIGEAPNCDVIRSASVRCLIALARCFLTLQSCPRIISQRATKMPLGSNCGFDRTSLISATICPGAVNLIFTRVTKFFISTRADAFPPPERSWR